VPFGFDGQVLIEADGELLLHRAYGVANRATGRAMTSDTRIGITSMSKQMVAAAILRLEELGRLAVTDSIARYYANAPADKAAITIHQLLTHTAGLRPGDIAGENDVASRDDLLRRIMAQPLAGKPGERWRYANTGYSLLAGIIEEVTGAPYEQFMVDGLFTRAGMRHTGFWHWPRLTEQQVAHSYRGWTDRGSPATWARDWRVYGAGDIVSTVADLYRWELALREKRILSAAALEKYMTPHVALGSDGRTSYAYGLFVHHSEDGRTVVEHGGDWQGGYNGVILRYVDEKKLIIVLATARDGHGQWLRQAVQGDLESIARGADSLIMAPSTRPVSKADRHVMSAEYALDGGGRIEFHDDGTYLWMSAEGQRAVSLLRDGNPEASAGQELGNAKTRALLSAVNADARAAYEAALTAGEAGAIDGYLREWSQLVNRFGALRGFELLGSVPFGPSIETTARLMFSSDTIPMSFLWRDRGEGRLMGTLIRDKPSLVPLLASYPVAALENGSFMGWDLFRKRGLVFDTRPGEKPARSNSLVFRINEGTVTARRP
jgi:CubicO group peptidase (beta-lactamase class C family)